MSLPQRPDEATRRLVDPACRVTLAGAANPVDDAAAERLKATFDSEELAAFLHDGVDKLQRRSVAPGPVLRANEQAHWPRGGRAGVGYGIGDSGGRRRRCAQHRLAAPPDICKHCRLACQHAPAVHAQRPACSAPTSSDARRLAGPHRTLGTPARSHPAVHHPPSLRSEELVKLLQSQPWSDKTHRYFLTREQEYVGGLEAAVGIWCVACMMGPGLGNRADVRPCPAGRRHVLRATCVAPTAWTSPPRWQLQAADARRAPVHGGRHHHALAGLLSWWVGGWVLHQRGRPHRPGLVHCWQCFMISIRAVLLLQLWPGAGSATGRGASPAVAAAGPDSCRPRPLSLPLSCCPMSCCAGGLELHIGMFIPTILGQGTPEQQAKWLPLCNRLQARVGSRQRA